MIVNMSLTSRTLLRHSSCLRWQKQCSTLANVVPNQIQDELSQCFRTIESNPLNHNEQHLYKLYTIPPYIRTLFQFNGIPKTFNKQIDTFNECSILIRNPAIEIISYLEQTDYSRPINKYVLYGKYGTGKSLTLMHILHYAFMKKMFIVHVPTPHTWFKFPKETSNFYKVPDIIDLPVDAGKWLRYFRNLNKNLLSQNDIKVSTDYEWSKREQTKKGSSLKEIIDFGVNRIRYASVVIEALLNELKQASIADKCKVLVVIDAYNAFWSDFTNIHDENKLVVSPKKILLTSIFTNFLKADWCNGAAVLAVDRQACKDRRESDHPKYLLGDDGFEHLDPFVPVLVQNYNKSEFESIIEYYKERKWIRDISSMGLTELWLLSNGNPLELITICDGL